MNRATFFKHFELLADQRDAVAKMRELVLQLAVQGKLVDQDSKDEPASKLLEQIQIQNQNRTAYHAVSAENAPYKAPTNWIWVKLGFLAEIERGGSPRPIKDYITDDPNGLNWIKIGDTEKGGKFITSTEEKIRKEGLKKTRKVYPGDFLLTNSMSFGRPYITKIEGCIHDGWLRIHPPRQITSDYLYCLLSSPFVYAFFSKAAAGAVVQNLNADKVRELPIPLPPLAEQRRIVAKVDELMALCDELEQRQQARQHASGLLQQSALHHLLAAREPQTFAAAWQRVRDHFHVLHDTPDAIPQLRQAILQLAVQGRLVPQNQKDERGQKVIERLSRRELPDADHVLDENFPSAWGITSFTNLAHIRSGVTKGRNLAGRKLKAFPYLRVANVQRGFLELDVMKEIEIPVEELDKFRLQSNDLLITEGGDWDKVGRTAIWRGEVADCIHQNHVFRGRLVSTELRPEWFMLYFNSPVGRRYFEGASKQTTNLASINATELRGCPVPIPPLAEQKRIVARVEELLRWCDTLEAQLHQTRTLGAHLLASTLHHLLAA